MSLRDNPCRRRARWECPCRGARARWGGRSTRSFRERRRWPRVGSTFADVHNASNVVQEVRVMLSRTALFKLLATVMAAGIAVAACGGTTPAASSAPTTAASAAPSAALGQLPLPELTKVRIGISTPTDPVQFPQMLAERLGFYKKYGISTSPVSEVAGVTKT